MCNTHLIDFVIWHIYIKITTDMKNSTNSKFSRLSSINSFDHSVVRLVENAQFRDYCNSFSTLEVALHRFKCSISAYKSNKSKRSTLSRILLEEALLMSEILSLQDRGQFSMH